jgi:radical SAM superfamily enzyme YgiQ (UPF0313 family)
MKRRSASATNPLKILFIATRKNSDPQQRELYEMDLMNEILGFQRSLLDLGLLTVAACTPDRFEVRFQDEYLAPLNYEEPCDLVALSAKTSCITHALEVARQFRARGCRVVLGGIHATLRPDEVLEDVDCIVTGEAEETWPQVLEDFERGQLQRRYDSQGFPTMDRIPPPRYANLDPRHFLFHQLQTTRGCPFRCRFCSVPDISGQAFRFKPVDRVLKEVKSMPRRGRLIEKIKTTYVVDDNFISRTPYTRDLLKALVPLARSGEMHSWSAETTLNVATDEELLDLFQEAGCTTLIIGFESVTEASLEAMGKGVNFCLTYQEAIERIHRRGLSIVGNFIVGFDTDDLGVFRRTRDFVFENNILYPFFSILTPMPGTALFDEFQQSGRLHHIDWSRYDTRHVVFSPAQMSVEQLQDGYCWLYEQCYTSDAAWENLQRFWRRPERAGSGFGERLFARWRVGRSRLISPEGRAFFQQAHRYMKSRGNKGDIAQLLYYLDSGHFSEFLTRYRSSEYLSHCEQFESFGRQQSTRMQWEHRRLHRKAAVVNP